MPSKKIITKIKSKKKIKNKIKNKIIGNNTKKGKLKQFGYSTTASEKTRRDALKKAIKKYGKNQVMFMLRIPGNMLKNKSPKKSIILLNDYKYLKNKA